MQPETYTELGKLKAYTKDGLELIISDTGAVYANQSALARMLGLQQGHLSSVLQSKTLPSSKDLEPSWLVRLPSARGTREQRLYGVSTMVALASRFNPELAQKFSEAGATVYLYGLAGYQAAYQRLDSGDGDKLSPDVLRVAQQAINSLLNQNKATQNEPGISAYLKLISAENNGGSLGGFMTLDQMVEACGVELTPNQARQIGRNMAGNMRAHGAESPTTTRKRVKDKSGNYQSYEVAEYPVKHLPFFRACCLEMGIPVNME